MIKKSFKNRSESSSKSIVPKNPAATKNQRGLKLNKNDFLDTTEVELDQVLGVNLKGAFLMAQAAARHMVERGSGVIINTASTAGLRPRPGLTWYNGSKGAVITITKSMAVELAPDNIRVNALCPVAGETPLLAKFMGGDTPEHREKFVSAVPLGRFSTPEDIAASALWLASDEAEFITGIALEIDGGRCI